MESDHLVETRGLTRLYGERAAIRNLNLTVRRGEVYGFLGPNGAGKTTTLRLLLGLIRPTSGSAEVVGRPPGHPEGLGRVGALVDSPAFYPYLSGRDNLRTLAWMTGVRRARVDQVLEEVDLRERAGDAYRTYSLGMKQRLGVASAMLKDPQLLILDEPTNGLDPQGMVEMRQLIRRLTDSGRTVMLSSHLLHEVEQICHRVGVVKAGTMIAEGTVSSVLTQAGGGALFVRAEPEAVALEILDRVVGRDRVLPVDGGGFRLSVDPERAAAINRALVIGGVSVSELRYEGRSLEAVFLRLTGEEAAS